MNTLYTAWHSDTDIQLIPVGEETIHRCDIICGCEPTYKMDEKNVVRITQHNSFVGEDFGQNVFVVPNQKRDC